MTAWTPPVDQVSPHIVSLGEWNAVQDNLNCLTGMTVVAGSSGSPVTWASQSVDDNGAFNASNAYLLILAAGYYEMTVQLTASGGTGTGTSSVQIDRYNSSGSLVETWAVTNSAPGGTVNQPINARGVGVCASNDRIVVTASSPATGSGPTVVTRGVLLRHR